MSKKYVYLFSEGNATMRELLGGKGANLAEMTNIGLPVPQGFTITTEACTQYYEDGRKINDEIMAEIMEYVAKMEEMNGKKFGDLKNPLLVSVRSGARASMPGMMDTILNLGLNDDVVAAMIAGNPDPNFERFGSSEYTIAMVDEVSEISERAVEVLFSRLRWRTHETFKTPRMLLTTNPTINWVRSRFVQDENGDKVICREGEAYIPFSVFDNPNIAFRQVYEAALNKIRDQATKERLLYGNWDFVEANDMAIYNSFDGSRHLVTGLKEKAYDPTKPLITVWDFNVAPQMSVLSAQIDYENRKVYILEEILGKPEEKENNTPALARKVRLKLYRDKHIGGVDVTGDPSGLQRSTTNEDGINNYTIITDTFGRGILRPKVKLLRKQPPQATRCEFVNEVFGGYEGWEIQIDIKCRKLTQDLIYQLRNEDGTKSKQKTTDPKTGVKYERYGHLSDCLDYLLCYYLRDSWYKFKSGGDGNGYVVSTSVIQEGFSY